MLKNILKCGVALASLTLGIQSAHAQTEAEAQSGTKATTARIDEIIVTARRREENAQTVPVSITALGAEQLSQKSIGSLEDLTRSIPGVRFTSEGGAGNTQISIRGLTKIPIGAGTPAVVTYFADVPLPADGTNLATFNLSSVQVLKGPQGTLFGRNTIGGAVLVVPQAPTYTRDAYFKIGYGNYNNVLAEAAINLPIVGDHLAVRVAAQRRYRDGFQKSIGTEPGFTGPDLDNLNQYSLRGSILWEPSTSFRNTLVVDYFKGNEAPGNTVVFGGDPAILAAFSPLFAGFIPDLAARKAQAIADGPLKTRYSLDNGTYQRKVWGIANTTTLEISPDISVKNIFGYRSTYLNYFTDVDGVGTVRGPALPIPGLPPIIDSFVIIRPGSITDSKQITNEFQVLGSALDDRLDYIAGLFYSRENGAGPAGRFFDQFDPQDASGTIRLNPPLGSTLQPDNISKAVFAQIGYRITDKLKLNLGGRYTWDIVKICSSQLSVGGTTPSDAGFLTDGQCKALAKTSPNLGVGVVRTTSQAPTWTIGLDYQASDDLFLYAVTRRGYRQGGVNAPLFNTPCTTQTGTCPVAAPPFVGNAVDLRPYQTTGKETVTDIEIGVKSDMRLGNVDTRLNLSVFRNKYKNATQFINVASLVSADSGFPSSGSLGVNAADLTIQGAEGEVALRMGGLNLAASASYLDQKVDKLFALPAPLTPLLNENSVTLPSAKWSGTVSGSYAVPIGDGSDIVLSGDLYWTGAYQAQATRVPGYKVANFRLDWKNIGGNNFDLGAYITNAFKKKYVLAAQVILPTFPINTASYGPPQMYGIELTYRFGR
jgi:iron complex outermembrane receptor protein